MAKARISVVLYMADTCFTEESDWKLWTDYVTEYLPSHVGEPVDVGAESWSLGAGEEPLFRDEIRTAESVGKEEHDAIVERVREAIKSLWRDGDWWYESTEAKRQKALEDAEYERQEEALAEDAAKAMVDQ